MTYHPYRNGWSVKPGLHRFPHHTGHDQDDQFFQMDRDFDRFIEAKRNVTHDPHLEHFLPELARETVREWIAAELNEPADATLDELAMAMQEDFAIHCYTEDRDWLAMLHFCFPSGWSPAEVIGESFAGTHADVPGMALPPALTHSMMTGGPFVRYNWGVAYSQDLLRYHKDRNTYRFNPSDPEVYVQVERQLTKGFPEANCAIFIVRQYNLDHAETDWPALLTALEGMPPEGVEYKGIQPGVIEHVRTLV
jgi:hypothetical protein